jgi:antirestriction protein ArdC
VSASAARRACGPAREKHDGLDKHFGDSAYAWQELIAEIGAAFLCTDLSRTLWTRDPITPPIVLVG